MIENIGDGDGQLHVALQALIDYKGFRMHAQVGKGCNGFVCNGSLTFIW